MGEFCSRNLLFNHLLYRHTSTSVQNGNNEEEDSIRAPITFTTGVLVPQSFDATYAQRGQPVRQSVFEPFGSESEGLTRDTFAKFMHLVTSAANRAPKRAADNDGEAVAQKRNRLAMLFQPPTDIMCPGNFETVRYAIHSSHNNSSLVGKAHSTARWPLATAQCARSGRVRLSDDQS